MAAQATTDEIIASLKARIRDLEDALGLNNPSLGVIFKLPQSLARLLGLLVAVPNVTPEMVQQQLEIVSDCKVAVHRLRSHLEPFDIEIQSRRSLGYWLDAATKDKIRALVTPVVTNETIPAEEVPVAPIAA